MRKKIVAGNWKMNKDLEEGLELIDGIKSGLDGQSASEALEVIVIPPFIHLSEAKKMLSSNALSLGAQNVHHEVSGAFTGEVSVQMLRSVGIDYCLVGHSERRIYQKETDDQLQAKIELLLSEGIKVIYCIGEALEDREAEREQSVVAQQLGIIKALEGSQMSQIVLAYEPVWAIGTGKTASAEQAQTMHAFIRKEISAAFNDDIANDCSILYGGSCKPDNAKELFYKADVDGGLIGGASLKAQDFLDIVKAARA